MKKKIKSESVIKKKVLKKAAEPKTEVKTPLVKTPLQVPAHLAGGVLKKGTKNRSGVTLADRIRAFDNVLYVGGRKLTMHTLDLYVALINRVKDKCNKRDWSVYESSTNDFAIRKDFERTLGDLKRAGYLKKNPDGSITLLKVIPPNLKLSKNGSS
jgi:hypothetical protein